MARDTYDGLVDLVERVISACVADALLICEQILDAMGPRPLFHERASLDEQLEQFIPVFDDPAFWQQWMAANIHAGPEAVWRYAVRECTRLLTALAKRGGWTGDPADLERAVQDGIWAVRLRAFQRTLGAADKAEQKVQRLIEQHPLRVIGPKVIPSNEDLLMGVA